MGGRRFYLYPRKNGVYYAELLNIDSARVLYRSTRSKNRDEAAAIVGRWLAEGVPVVNGRLKKPLKEAASFRSTMKYITTSEIDEEQAIEIARALKGRGLLALGVSPAGLGNREFIQFLHEFWDYDNSPYLKDRRAHGANITRRTCRNAFNIINRYWEPFFMEKGISEITRKELREFGLALREKLAGKTVNNVLHIGTPALRWAYSEKMIPENIVERLGGFVGGGKKRDILTEAEIEKLKDIKYWNNKKAYAAFRLASTSALRAGECRALRGEDIGEKVLFVRHGYNHIDKLKPTKNSEERMVYLLPEVRALLLSLLEENPLNEDPDKQFIFFQDRAPEKPCGSSFFVKYLHLAIKKAGIPLAGRRIDFHSLRHYVATKWADGTGDLRAVARVTGHRDLKMAAHYSNHDDEKTIAEMGKTAANILNFTGNKGA